jgi:hypothetical protein
MPDLPVQVTGIPGNVTQITSGCCHSLVVLGMLLTAVTLSVVPVTNVIVFIVDFVVIVLD